LKVAFLTLGLWLGAVVAGSALADSPTVPASVPYGNNDAAGKFYDIRGIKIYAEIYGAGPPLLLLHGNGGDISAFSGNIPYFAQHYRVIAMDSRDQGRSTDNGTKLTFEEMADDSAALLDVLHIKSADVLGWSDGGIVALLMAIRHPDKVLKLAASGANLWPGPDAFGPDEWQEMTSDYEARRNEVRTTDDEKDRWKLFLLDYEEPHISLRALHTIRCACLIIGGDRDLITVAHTTLISQNIPKAQLWIVPNAHHDVLVNHRDQFNQNVDQFFRAPAQL
jgi:pimeloyl-ACP methyl ester carboxylesterase